VARLTWPGEANDELTTLQGAAWVPCLLLAAGLSLTGALFSGRLTWRFTAADLAVLALGLIILATTRHAADRRIAWNLAWEWLGVTIAYLLARSLPRAPRESLWLANLLAATATAVAAYGLYQVAEVLPETRRAYLENPEATLRQAGVSTDPAARRQFEDRLLGSLEPTGPYALANSLAGVLLLPTAVVLALWAASWQSHPRAWSITALSPILLCLFCCLLLTKSRTAYVGLAVAVAWLAWTQRRSVSPKMKLALAACGLVGIAGLIAVLVATGQLDPQVLTEARKSLGYRWEYWVGTRRVLEDNGAWWRGLGPGNFSGSYLQHKLPQASEGISDPHNFLLEVWSTGGLFALLALVAALVLGLAQALSAFGPNDKDEPQLHSTWSSGLLSAAAGIGGLALGWAFRPDLATDVMRWLVMGCSWILAMLCLEWRAWPARKVAIGLSAGVLGIVVSLLGAGGIGFSPVALMLWVGLALGLNVRVDRPCGRVREGSSRTASAVWLACLAALGGTWLGTMAPAFSAAASIDAGERHLRRARDDWSRAAAGLPTSVTEAERARLAYAEAEHSFRAAGDAFRGATRADQFGTRGWEHWAMAELMAWRARGAPTGLDDLVWHRVDSMLRQGMTRPRNPDSLALQALRARMAGELLAVPGWPQAERDRLQADRLDATRALARLNPTSAAVQAALSEAAAGAGRNSEAIEAARRALDLDRITPHIDKKLPDSLRKRMRERIGVDQDRVPNQGSTPRV
jgi:hypothetical protein